MNYKRKLSTILISSHPHPRSPQEAWTRQQRSAAAIIERFEQGKDTVLLADEVGMGKTYVALATMAGYLFQSDSNDRKVLLITPPSTVLRVKWQQEIQSFNEHYLIKHEAKSHKNMQAITINNYWDLMRNLKDVTRHDLQRVDEELRLCFTWCLFNWAYAHGKLGRKRRILWSMIAHLSIESNEIVSFLGHYSEHAIWRFLDDDYNRNSRFYDDLFINLQKGSFATAYDREENINARIKCFADQQDVYEPNVYVIGMNALKPPRIDDGTNRFFFKYLLSHLLSGLHQPKCEKLIQTLVGYEVLPDKSEHLWKSYYDDVYPFRHSEFYGLKASAIEVLKMQDIREKWKLISNLIVKDEADAKDARDFFKLLSERIFSSQLRRANIGLTVIDEVHNWKSGSYGAKEFERLYAPNIENKLAMSATPFQMEEGEMTRIFNFVQAQDGGSKKIMDSLSAPNGEIASCIAASNAFRDAWQSLCTKPEDSRRLQEIFENVANEVVDNKASHIAQDNTESDEIRQLCSAFGKYRDSILKLQNTLGQVVIRHTKSREKRDFQIGEHFEKPNQNQARNSLYPARGYANPEDALVNFIGMRLGQLVQREEKKSYEANARLLGGMTSSTAAFLQSANELRKSSPATRVYREMFEEILNGRTHPKVAATVNRSFQNFKAGRKTLIFCERIATLEEIKAALKQKIDAYTASESNVVSLTRSDLLKKKRSVENIWWHSLWDAIGQRDTGFMLLDKHLLNAQEFANRCIRYFGNNGVKPSPVRIIKLLDIWLIGNAVNEGHFANSDWKPALDFFSKMFRLLDPEAGDFHPQTLEDFLSLKAAQAKGNDGDTDKKIAEDVENSDDDDSSENKTSIDSIATNQYRDRKNLWVMNESKDFHASLWHLLTSEAIKLKKVVDTGGNTSESMFESTMVFFDLLRDLMVGVRLATLRDDLLVRYATASDSKDPIERIAIGMRSMKIGHDNSMLDRMNRFLKCLVDADGSISRSDLTQSKRKSMWQGVSMTSLSSVSTLDGSTPAASRAGLCAAFNSPLLPDILICTSIGSEGIDLHHQCADVIHHDLPWNPAKLEQRNGRVDRVGSLATMSNDARIHIGIPFLANNYEQFQYSKVYSRAQKFEVLLGRPDFVAEDLDEEDINTENGDVKQEALTEDVGNETIFPPLPRVLIESLRLDLSVRIND